MALTRGRSPPRRITSCMVRTGAWLDVGAWVSACGAGVATPVAIRVGTPVATVPLPCFSSDEPDWDSDTARDGSLVFGGCGDAGEVEAATLAAEVLDAALARSVIRREVAAAEAAAGSTSGGAGSEAAVAAEAAAGAVALASVAPSSGHSTTSRGPPAPGS